MEAFDTIGPPLLIHTIQEDLTLWFQSSFQLSLWVGDVLIRDAQNQQLEKALLPWVQDMLPEEGEEISPPVDFQPQNIKPEGDSSPDGNVASSPLEDAIQFHRWVGMDSVDSKIAFSTLERSYPLSVQHFEFGYKNNVSSPIVKELVNQ